MKIFGMYLGRADKIEKAIRDRMNIDIQSTIDRIVGNEVADLRGELERLRAEKTRLEGQLELQTGEKEKYSEKYKLTKALVGELNGKVEFAQERVVAEAFNFSRKYAERDPKLILDIVSKMADERKLLPYLRSFFNSHYGIDQTLMHPSDPPGLQLIRTITASVKKVDLERIRAYSTFIEGELKRAEDSATHKKLFDYFISEASRGKFDKALELYRKKRVHHDYVLNLTETERDLIRLRDQRYRGSWADMLKIAEGSERDTKLIRMKDDPAFSVNFIKKLAEYEVANNVKLSYPVPEKDF